MKIDSYTILIILSIIVILSSFFDFFAKKIKIPSVLMLLGVGMLLRYISTFFDFTPPNTKNILEIFGIIGLILIVLEGALDLKLTKERLPLIRKSFSTAFFTFLATALLIAFFLHQLLGVEFQRCLVNAIPLAVVSSAITIPSVLNLTNEKKEFLTYESTFSDIIGIMFFNFVIQDGGFGINSIMSFILNFIIIIGISIAFCFLLLFFIEKTRFHVKFILIISFLVLVYSVGKMLHLSSLLLVLIFGLVLNNSNLLFQNGFGKYFKTEKLYEELKQLKLITAESAFLIRTFFFILFGFSFHLQILLDNNVLILGGIIIIAIYFVRYLYLQFAAKVPLIPELFIAPRGLITILLFYSIPPTLIIETFSEGILFFTITVTSILLMIGLLVTKTKKEDFGEYLQ